LKTGDSRSSKKKDRSDKHWKRERRGRKNKEVKSFLRPPTPDFRLDIEQQLEVYNELAVITRGDQSPELELDFDVGLPIPPTPGQGVPSPTLNQINLRYLRQIEPEPLTAEELVDFEADLKEQELFEIEISLTSD